MIRQVVQSSAFDCIGPPGGGGSDRPPDRPVLPPISGSSGANDHSNQRRRSVGKHQNSEPPKPFLRDRLRRLPNAPIFASESQCAAVGIAATEADCVDGAAVCGGAGSADERRLQFLECSVTFLREQHAEMLNSLHAELDLAKRKIQELQFRLVMAEEHIILRKRRDAFEQNREQERRRKREAEASELAANSYCVPVERLNVSIPPATGSAWLELPHSPIPRGFRVCCTNGEQEPGGDQQRPVNTLGRKAPPTLAPLTSHSKPVKKCAASQQQSSSAAGASSSSPKQQYSLQKRKGTPQQESQDRQPQQLEGLKVDSTPATVAECQAIIRRLQTENERQARELLQLNANLRDAMRTHQKIGPEGTMASRQNNGTSEHAPCNQQRAKFNRQR